MDNTPQDFWRIPVSGESDDPCENPFPPKDARYRVWADATRQAEEELSQLKIELLDQPRLSPEQMLDYLVRKQVRQFHIWAKRGVHVVWGDSNIAPYNDWLVAYAEAILKLVWERCPIHIHKEYLLLELRRGLMREVEYFKAAARRDVSQQNPDRRAEDGLPKSNATGATEPKENQSTRTDVGPAVSGAPSAKANGNGP